MSAVVSALPPTEPSRRRLSGHRSSIIIAVLAVIALVLPAAVPIAGAADRIAGAVALYDFTEGAGSTVADSSGFGAPLDLTIADPGNTTWGPGGLTLDAATTVSSAGNATKVINAVQGSGAVTVELWIEPSNTTQDGPARIFSISQSPTKRDLTVGQGLFGSQPTTVFDTRLRTTATSTNGTPSLSTPQNTATTDLQHVVFTRTPGGVTTTYVDGQAVAVGSAGGTLGNWAAMPLLLGNEVGGSRPWLGRYCLTAVYASALTAAEVDQNYDAGCTAENTAPTANDDSAIVVQGNVVTIDVAANDVDSDGSIDPESITIVDVPAEGDVTVDGGGEVTYSSTGALGDDTFTYTIADDEGEVSNAATVTVTVREENAPPTIDPIDDQTGAEGDTIALAVTATDPNGDDLTYSATGLPEDLDIDAATGAITGDLSQTSAGSYSIVVTADDGLGGTDTEPFTFTIDAVNVAPVITPIGDQQVATGPVEIQVVATDADGDAVTFSATGLPDDLTITPSSGMITGTAATPGVSSVEVTASDPTDGVATATFSLTILAVDVSPIVEYRFDDGTGTTVADSSGSGSPLDLTIANPGNTTWLPNGLQVDAATSIASANPATKVTDAVGGSGEITVDLYVEAGLVNQFGPARILSISNSATTRNITIGQGGGRSKDPQTTLDVRLRSTATSVNGTPSLTSPTGVVNGDPQHVTFTRDAGGATTLTVDGAVVATGTAGGSLANWASTMPLILGNEIGSNRPWLGTYCYAAIYDQIHTQAELALRQDGCSTADDNASPEVDPIEDQTNDPGDVVSLTATASDADGDPVVFSGTGFPPGVTIDSAGAISGTIDAGAGGAYPSTVTATDPDGATGTASFTWTVIVPNVPPTANDDSASVVAGGSTDIDVAGNDVDTDGTLDLGSVEVLTPPTAGTTSVSPAGLITYTSTGSAGSDSFTYRLADDDGDFSNEATVSITVLAENTPPTITPIGDQTNDEGETIALAVEAADDDDNDLTFAATGLPDALTIDPASGVISGDLTQTSAGVYPVEVSVDDGVGGTATDSFTWTVNVVDVAPTVDDIDDQQNQAGDTVSLSVVAADEDGDTLEFAATGLPASLTIDASTGAITGDVTDAPGVYPVTVTVTDPGGNFAETSFDWTVLEASPRVDGALALYEFEDGVGATVADTSGVGPALDLTIADTDDVSWAPGALTLDASTTVSSGGPATKITDAVTSSGELTVEAWIKPANTTQSGPARIVSISESPFSRDMTLGQGTFGSAPTDTFDLRLRSTTVGDNGSPSTTTPAGAATTDLTHVVATRAADGSTTIYVDGQVVQTSTVGGDLSNWAAMPLLLGNEATGDRPWLGTLCLTAVYDTALSGAEVGQNFDAGCEIGSNASALLTVNDGDNNIEASTFNAGSFEFTNTSTAGVELQSFSLDLSTSLYNDVVFDPNGDAGDVGSKCFEPNAAQATATGLQEPAGGTPPNCDNSMFAGPHEGGFDVLNLTFDDFDAEESFSFSVDNDPTSIQGVPVTGNSGAISGFELIGSTVTMTFADPNGDITTLTGRLFTQDTGDANGLGDGASQLILDQSAPAVGPLDLAVDGVTLNATGFSNGATAAVVPDAAQQVTLTGPAGADVRLLVVESSYDEPEGFDKEPFEANRADVIATYDASLDATGSATIAVTLPNADSTHDANNGDLYQLVAAISDAPLYGGTSNIVVLELDPTAGPASPVVTPVGTVSLVIDEAGQVPISATDANGDPITLSIDSTPDITALGATFTQPQAGVGEGVIEWTPSAADVGAYSVTVTASDPTPSPDGTATFTLNVVEESLSGGSAEVAIAPGGGIDASTFGGGFDITNTSTGGQTISSVTYDLSTAILPDMVFDPVGTAGDATAKCLEPSAGVAATGYVTPADNCVDPFSQPHNGVDDDEGFDAVTAAFGDFGTGETFSFAVDVDPTSIKDVAGAGNAGAVSGLELAGSTITVVFSDGSVVVETFQTGASVADSSVTASGEPRDSVILSVDGLTLTPQPDLSDSHSAAAVPSETQTIVVTGPADTDVRLLRVESARVQTPSYDPDAFEANKAIAVETYDVTLDATGTASVPVTLTDTVTGGVATDDTGLNYFAAVIGGGTATGPLSNIVVLDLDPTVSTDPVAVDDLVSAEPGSSTVIDVLANDTSPIGLDPASVNVTSGPTGGTVVGPDATGALTYNAEQGFDDADGDSFTYTVADTDGTVSNEATVTISDSTAEATVIARINAGGAEYVDVAGNTWSADTNFVNGTAFPATPKTGEAIAGTEDDLLYQTERFGGAPGDPALAYTFDVAAGTYEIDVLMAEIYFGAATTPSGPGGAGQRVFSGSAEGQPIFTDLDLFAEDGPAVARVETITVQVTDGTLNLDFAATVDNAKVSALEIRRLGAVTPTPPTVDAIADTTVAEDNSVTIPVTTTELDGDAVTLTVTGAPDISAFATFTDAGDGTGSLVLDPVTGDAGTYDVTVTATDVDGSDDETFVLTVTEPVTGGQVLARINAGGPEVAAIDGGLPWEADANPGHPFLTDGGSNGNAGFPAVEPGPTVAATTPGEIFDTERWSNSGFSYGVPAPAGTQVAVRLFLGNGFPGTSEPGARVFDIAIDGTLVADDLDLSTQFGHEVGGMLEFLITSDGTVDVAFINDVQENPLLNGLEVLSAESQPGQLGVSPTAIDFPPTLPGSDTSRTITLTNLGFDAGDPAITVTDATISAGEFTTDLPGGGLTIASGDSATVDVTFAPSTVGPQTGTLSLAHDGDNSPIDVALSGQGVSDIPVSFSSSGLAGESLNNPTSLEFGPDDRLYVSQQNGLISAYTVVRNGPDDYDVTATETIDLVQDIVNHNDDGSVNSGVNNRQVTGLMTAGTAANPILYVTSSDPRIGAGGGGNDANLDTNSGVVSRLLWNGAEWEHVQLVRGLPRSEENHATNGLDLDPATNTLFVAQGGHANKGAPSNNFAGTSEYYLSGAILALDLDALEALPVLTDSQGQAYAYNLPTLDDPSRDDSTTDPFGGNNGLNMAVPEPGGPVQIHSPGYRNNYDVVFTTSGELYTSDNGPNTNWGGQPLIYDSTGTLKGHEGQAGVDFDAAAGDYCTNEFNEGGSQGHGDPLFHVSGEGFYGGHPAPIRAFPGQAGVYVYEKIGGNWQETAMHNFGDLLPAGLTLADFPDNPVECDYQANDSSKYLDIINSSTNGIAEYAASNFGGAMQGNLLTASFNGNINRYELNATGDDTIADEVIFNGFGSTPLDVTTLGDSGPFPGTVWAATYGADNITVFEPADYDGNTGGPCTGADDPALDEDNDGFDNADEIAAGTDPCSGGSQPNDADGDFISDVTDDDDDNDGTLDTVDPFAIDDQNGLTTALPIAYPLENENPGTGILGLGFTGLMTNGTDTWIDQYDEANLAAGGAVGALTVEAVPPGDAITGTNTQQYGFQFGVDVDDSTDPFIVHTQVESPFFTSGGNTESPDNFESNGLFIGTGSQDEYLKLVFGGNGGPVTQVLLESGGSVGSDVKYDTTVTGDFLAATAVDLYLEVDPQAGTVQPRISLDDGATITDLGTPVAIPAPWFDGTDNVGLAVGIISTSNGGTPFAATWDFIDIGFVPGPTNTPPTIDPISDASVAEGDPFVLDVVAGDADADPLTYALSGDVPAGMAIDAAGQITYTPDLDDSGTYALVVEVDDGVNPAVTEDFALSVTQTDTGTVLARINAGGPGVTSTDGGPDWTANPNPNTLPQLVAGGDNVFASSSGSGVPVTDITDPTVPAGTPLAVFQTERWDPAAAPEMAWNFPVNAGDTIEVRIGQAEIFNGVTAAGQRAYDVVIDGVPAEQGIDPFGTVGSAAGFVTDYVVTADGDGLDIEFIHVTDNPNPKSIEIIQVSATNAAPTLTADDPAPSVAEGDTAVVTVTATDGDGDTVALTASGLPGFASFDPGTGELTISPQSGDAAGSPYLVTVEGDDGNGGTDSVDIDITVTAPAPDPDPLDVVAWTYGAATHRVNAGGPEIPAADGGVPWGEDQVAAGNGGTAGTGVQSPQLDPAYAAQPDGEKKAYGSNGPITLDPSVPADAPISMLEVERWDPATGLEMGYDFDVPAGTPVEVRLYFAELFQTGTPPTPRIFDVQIDGQTVATDINQLADYGHDVAFMLPFVIDSDGTIDVDFIHNSENPAIKGIEIIELVTAADAAPNSEVGFLATLTNPAGNGPDATLSAVGVSVDGGAPADVLGTCDAAPIAPGDTAECRFTNTVNGSGGDVIEHVVVATADFDGATSDVESSSGGVNITLVETLPETTRINAGGPTVASTDLGPDWAADQTPPNAALTIPSGSSLGGFPVGGRDASVPAYAPQDLYQTERWDGTNGTAPDDMTYDIPVGVGGDATVNLFMANGWPGSANPGERLFDVYIEGALVLDEFDLSATYGHQVGGMETFAVTDTDADGLITMVFEHGTGPQNPLVNAIEVVPEVGTN